MLQLIHKQSWHEITIVFTSMEHEGSPRLQQNPQGPRSMCPTHKDSKDQLQVHKEFFDLYLVMQVRILTEAPHPQLREQTDQPLHDDHSFLKCSCRRARAGRPEDAAEGPQEEIHDCGG